MSWIFYERLRAFQATFKSSSNTNFQEELYHTEIKGLEFEKSS